MKNLFINRSKTTSDGGTAKLRTSIPTRPSRDDRLSAAVLLPPTWSMDARTSPTGTPWHARRDVRVAMRASYVRWGSASGSSSTTTMEWNSSVRLAHSTSRSVWLTCLKRDLPLVRPAVPPVLLVRAVAPSSRCRYCDRCDSCAMHCDTMSLNSCPWKDLPVLELRYGPPRRTHTAALLLLPADLRVEQELLAVRPRLTILTSSIRSSIEGPTDSSANGSRVGSLADGRRNSAACLAITSMAARSVSSPPLPASAAEDPSASNRRLLAALPIALELPLALVPATAPTTPASQFSSSSSTNRGRYLSKKASKSRTSAPPTILSPPSSPSPSLHVSFSSSLPIVSPHAWTNARSTASDANA